MKNIHLKYTLLSVAITSSLLFTACGKKSEPVNEVPETTTMEETTTDENINESEETTVEEETIENTTESETVENNSDTAESINQVSTELGGSTSIEEIPDEISPLNNGIVKNSDGTFSYTEEFLNTIQTINGFSDLTQANKEKLLQEVAPFILEMDNESDIICALESFVRIYKYDETQAEEEQTKKEQQAQQAQQKTQNSQQQAPDNIGPGPMDDFFTPEDGTAGGHLGTGTISNWR